MNTQISNSSTPAELMDLATGLLDKSLEIGVNRGPAEYPRADLLAVQAHALVALAHARMIGGLRK